MSASRIAALGAVLLPSLLAHDPVHAQIRASEPARVSQTVDGTTITVEYSRPVARGRELFGDLVPYGITWTPGANWATTLEVDRDIRVNGADVAAGTYSVWMTPRPDAWTLTLHPEARIFHFQKPDSTDAQIHIAAQTEPAPHTEMLTWSFPAVTGDAAVLRMQWGTTAVPLRIVVQPTKPVALPAEDRALYTGSWSMEFIEGMGWPTAARLEILEKDGMLRGRMPFPIHPGDELEFDLVPAGPHRFHAGLYREGRLFNVEMGASFEFDAEGARATAVRMRGIEGSVFGEGKRASQ